MADEQTYDIICVGSGAAGCAAALSAVRHGLKVCLVEKSARLGGGTAYSYGGLWVGANHLQEKEGIADSLDEAREYLEFLAAGQAVAENLETYITETPRVLRAYEDFGLKFRIIHGVPDHYFPDAPGAKLAGRTLEVVPAHRSSVGPWANSLAQGPYIPPGVSWTDAIAWGGFGNMKDWDPDVLAACAESGLVGAGEGLIVQLVAGLVARDVPIIADFQARELIVEDKRVTGLRGSVAGAETVLHARLGVILATGGYEANPELVRQFEGNLDWLSVFPPEIQGDGLKMGTEIGAALFRVPVNLCVMLGYRVPSETPGEPDTFRNAGIRGMYPHSMLVNRAGSRFADESRFQYVIAAMRHFDPGTHSHLNDPCFLVFDSQYLARYSFAARAPGAPPPPWLKRSDTLAGLAEQLGIDPAGLEQGAERFNGHAAEGVDPDFDRGLSEWSQSSTGDLRHGVNPNLAPVQEPPFYGVPLCQSGMRSAGLLTDTNGRVMHVTGRPIDGLYACGNAAAPTEYGVGYQAGLTLMSGLLFGYRAARHAAGLPTSVPV